MKRMIQKLRRDTRGAGFVEYIILIGLIALASLAIFTEFGELVNEKTAEQIDTMEEHINTGPEPL